MESYIDSAGRKGPAFPVDRVPPHNDEIEKMVLGMIVHEPNAVVKDVERLGIGSKSFYALRHQAVFKAIEAVMRDKMLPDTLTVWKRLKDNRAEEDILNCLVDLPEWPPAGFEQYVEQLHELRHRRQIITYADIIRNCAHDPAQSLDVVAGDLERVIEWERERSATGLTMRRPDEIMAMSFDDNDCYVGNRLIAAGQSTTIIGPGGIGKSRVLLQLAADCITGREFLGLPTRAQGKRWLILQAENSNRRLRNDLEKLRAWLGEEGWNAFNEKVIIHTLETEEDCLLTLDASAAVTGMERAITQFAPDIVAIDALYNFVSGDLNSDAEMRRSLQALSRIARKDDPKRAIVILHHSLTGKAGVSKAVGFDRSGYGRNSKVLHSWTRAQINIATGSAEDNNSLIVSCGKNNNGQEFKRFAVRLDTERMIYEVNGQFDWDAWQEQLQDGKPVELVGAPEVVRELCTTAQSKSALAKALMEETGCVRPSAYRFIKRAEQSGQIRFNESEQVYLAC
jgi:hypothetical protein